MRCIKKHSVAQHPKQNMIHPSTCNFKVLPKFSLSHSVSKSSFDKPSSSMQVCDVPDKYVEMWQGVGDCQLHLLFLFQHYFKIIITNHTAKTLHLTKSDNLLSPNTFFWSCFETDISKSRVYLNFKWQFPG